MANKYIVRAPNEELHVVTMEEFLYQNMKGANLKMQERIVFMTAYQYPEGERYPYQDIRTDGDNRYRLDSDGKVT